MISSLPAYPCQDPIVLLKIYPSPMGFRSRLRISESPQVKRVRENPGAPTKKGDLIKHLHPADTPPLYPVTDLGLKPLLYQ
jgi:hypothetical protein